MKRRVGLCILCGVVIAASCPPKTHAAGKHAVRAPLLHLHLCMSFPFGVAVYAALANGARRGIQLANGQWKGRLAAVGIALDPPVAFDNTGPDATDFGVTQERQDAQKCLADPHAIAYIGGLRNGAAAVAEPILNAGGMLTVSPGAAASALTDPSQRSTHEPATYNHTLKYPTFFRMVTLDGYEAPVAAAFTSTALHARSYFLVEDKPPSRADVVLNFSRYAQRRLHLRQVGLGQIDSASAASVAETADAVTAQVAARRPPAVFYGGNPEDGGALLRRLRAKGDTVPFVSDDLLLSQQFLADNGSAAANVFAVSAGLDSRQAAASFQAAYRRYFPHKALGPDDAAAYDAAGIVLSAIYAARRGGTLHGSIGAMRRELLPVVAAIHYTGATGPIAFDKNGDTLNRVLTVYQMRAIGWQPAVTGHISGSGGANRISVTIG